MYQEETAQLLNYESSFHVDCIRTFSGKYIDVFNTDPSTINIVDIAHSLANQCSHLSNFYSVAQHSYICSYLAPKGHELAALLHDASEAYLLDIPTPIKRKLDGYKALENKLMEVIAKKYKFSFPLSDEVHNVDRNLFIAEWNSLVLQKDNLITPMKSSKAKKMFLKRYDELK